MSASDRGTAPASRVTIREVARVAGVSRQTVTRAINGMAEISEDTRERVMRTVDELGYRPNRFAIDLSRQRNPAVGLIVGTFRNPYYAQLADAFIIELRQRDWQVVVGTRDYGEEEALRSMATQTDAVIGYFLQPQDRIVSVARGLPIVQLEERAAVPGLHSVVFDLEKGVADVVDGLRTRGARRFGMIDAENPEHDGALGSPRRRFFEKAVGEACVVVTQPESIAGGMNGFRQLMSEDPDVDAVLAFNDLMAMGAMQAAHGLDIDVPGRVRIVGIDGIALGEAVSPTLSTLSLEAPAVASNAVEILASVFAGEVKPGVSITRTVDPVVLWRESA